MTPAEILKMIETVDPADTAKLDEIDQLVLTYILDIGYRPSTQSPWQYTRSRDALKAIRPEGWEPIGCNDDLIGGFSGGWKFTMYNVTPFVDRRYKVSSAYCKTEELAELHSIIQAISYERSKQ